MFKKIIRLKDRNPIVWAKKGPVAFLKNMRWRLVTGKSDMNVVFIPYVPRSGSTLLQSLLASHPDCYSVDTELSIFTFGQDLFWRKRFSNYVQEEVLENVYRNSKDVTSFFEGIYGSLTGGQDYTWVVEKYLPHPLMYTYLSCLFPQARFIAIVRNVLDSYCSSLGHAGVSTYCATSVEEYARTWKKWARRCLEASNGGKGKLVRYEDLVAAPERVCRDVFSWLGCEYHDVVTPENRKFDKRSELKMFVKLSGPINSTSVGRWKADLDPETVDRFIELVGDELEMLGYMLKQ